jgi:hypothetical protein
MVNPVHSPQEPIAFKPRDLWVKRGLACNRLNRLALESDVYFEREHLFATSRESRTVSLGTGKYTGCSRAALSFSTRERSGSTYE